jgi:hypothetical protein
MTSRPADGLAIRSTPTSANSDGRAKSLISSDHRARWASGADAGGLAS